MFNTQHIDEYQIEITTHCNAACPQCPRNINGGPRNPYLPLMSLSRERINQTFTAEICRNLRQIFFCGSYGDPIVHPEFIDILKDFRTKNPTLWLYLHTNGGVQDPEWWTELARVLGPHGKIDFGIDGLADTNHLYRRNVRWSRLMANVQAFIAAGGNAQWNFIVFQHNQHQIEEARALSKTLGFTEFLPRRTGRFYDHGTNQPITQWPVVDRRGNFEYYIEPTTLPEYRNASIVRIDEIKQVHGDFSRYLNTTKIRCDSLHGRKVAISATGLLMPCNFFTHNLYDARFKSGEHLPGANALSFEYGRNQIELLLEQFGEDNLNINHRSLDEIFNNGFWQALVDSWTKEFRNGRIFECAHTCGQQFTKVWDQGGNKT